MRTLTVQNQIIPKRGGLTLCLGEETGENIQRSLVAAAALARQAEYGPVLYLNTFQTSRQLGSTIREEIDPEFSSKKQTPGLTYFTAPVGSLASNKGTVQQFIEELQPKTIIINSLDFASKDYRRKEELIFSVMEWLGEYDVSIVIFSELGKNFPKPGKIQRHGGVGKLAALAEEVLILSKDEGGRMKDEGGEEVESGGTPAAAGQSVKGASKEISLNGLRVRSTGVIDTESGEDAPPENTQHYPMTNKNRKLVAEYEKENGKQARAGETYREMFDRVLRTVLGDKTIFVSDKPPVRNDRKDGMREMLSA